MSGAVASVPLSAFTAEYPAGTLQLRSALLVQKRCLLLSRSFPLERLGDYPDIFGNYFGPDVKPQPQAHGVKPVEAAVPPQNLFNHYLPILRTLAFHQLSEV
jgi:hypothetical protein